MLLLEKFPLPSYLVLALRSKILNWFRRNTNRSFLVSLALFSLSCLPAHAETYDLLLSTSSNRANSELLSGKSVAGNIYVFTSPENGVAQVQFFLDNPNMTGTPKQTESNAPYDFAGGSSTVANPFNTDTLAAGAHTITAKILLSNGTSQVVSAAFTTGSNTSPPSTTPTSPPVSNTPPPSTTPTSPPNTTRWSNPIKITTGGTYTGNWRSTNPDIPAVKVNTSEPVTIENCQIESAGDGISSIGVNANVTVRNCRGQGLNPNIANRQKGYFINIGNFSQAIIENNTINSFGTGIRALNYGTAVQQLLGQTLTVRLNSFKNVDGRLSDGKGGYLTTLSGSFANAIGLNSLRSANVEIAWNEVINQPFQSRVEDLISTYGSSGTASNKIAIHDNYLQGGYAPDPTANVNYSGQMINVGDRGESGVGYVHVYNNQVVSFENGGIFISSGHDNEVNNNRIISAQKASDGTILGGNWRAGLSFWDYYNNSANWYNNSMHDNSVNVVGKNGTAVAVGPMLRSIGGSNTVTGTTDALGHLATQADELAEYQYWTKKKAGVAIGCWSWTGCQ